MTRYFWLHFITVIIRSIRCSSCFKSLFSFKMLWYVMWYDLMWCDMIWCDVICWMNLLDQLVLFSLNDFCTCNNIFSQNGALLCTKIYASVTFGWSTNLISLNHREFKSTFKYNKCYYHLLSLKKSKYLLTNITGRAND